MKSIRYIYSGPFMGTGWCYSSSSRWVVLIPNNIQHGVSTHFQSNIAPHMNRKAVTECRLNRQQNKLSDWTSWNVIDGCLTKHNSPEELCQSLWLIWAEMFIQPTSKLLHNILINLGVFPPLAAEINVRNDVILNSLHGSKVHHGRNASWDTVHTHAARVSVCV